MRSICLCNPDAWIQLSQPAGCGLHWLQQKFLNIFVNLMDLNWTPKYCK